MPALIVLSGAQGAGKTAACLSAAQALPDLGYAPRGVVCPGAYRNGVKAGIFFRDLGTGRERILAEACGPRMLPGLGSPRLDMGDPENPRYGMWRFHGAVLREMDRIARDAVAEMDAGGGQGAPACAFVDEIGPLEMAWGIGLVRTLARIDAAFSAPAEATRGMVIVTCRSALADTLAGRWPAAKRVDLDGLGAACALGAIVSIARSCSLRS